MTANAKKRRARRCDGDGDGEGGDNEDGGHDGCKMVAHHIGLDNISLPGRQWPSKTITVQGSRQAWLINFNIFVICILI